MTAESMWVARLDELDLPAGLEGADRADIYPAVLESMCGATDDSQPDEQCIAASVAAEASAQ